MLSKLRFIHTGCRIGLVTAAFVAAAASASAQSHSFQMGIGTNNPHTNFNGSSLSRVALDLAGNLTISAGAEFVTSVQGQQYLIVSVYNGPRALDANGRCDGYNVGDPNHADSTTQVWFYALDSNGANPACYSEFQPNMPTPPGVYGAFHVQTRVDSGGNMIGGTADGATDACGALNGDDLCITGVALKCVTASDANGCFAQGGGARWQIIQGPGVLLTAKMKTNLGTQVFASMPHAAFGNTTGLDLFEFVFQVSGGLLAPWYAPASLSDPRKFLVVQAGATPSNGANGTTPFVDFNTPFSESVIGAVDSASWSFLLPPADPCNGKISGSVTDYFSLSGVSGAEVQLTTQPNVVPAANGAYSSASNLCAGTYTVTALPPTGYAVYGDNSTVVNVVTSADGTANSIVSGVNFQMYQTVTTGSFTTFMQAQWGTRPKGNNAGALLATYFDFLYPDDDDALVIGDPSKFTVTETSAASVLDFLPQEGRPLPLSASYVDPPSRLKLKFARRLAHHRRLGSLAGETLALQLNVEFSNMCITRCGLGALKLTTGKLKGYTVAQVLAIANSVLGGNALPLPLKCYDDLEDIVEAINKNVLAGVDTRGYLAQ